MNSLNPVCFFSSPDNRSHFTMVKNGAKVIGFYFRIAITGFCSKNDEFAINAGVIMHWCYKTYSANTRYLAPVHIFLFAIFFINYTAVVDFNAFQVIKK